MNNITFVIFTYNEEKRIERVIKNLKDYGTVLIADNKSKNVHSSNQHIFIVLFLH